MSKNMRNFAIFSLVIIGLLVLITVFLRDFMYYRTAMKEKDIENCERYLSAFPKGRGMFTDEVRELKDVLVFQEAKSKHSLSQYEAYISEFPKGKHYQEARTIAEELRLEEIRQEPSFGKIRSFMTKYADSKLKEEAEKIEKGLWKKAQRDLESEIRSRNLNRKWAESLRTTLHEMQGASKERIYCKVSYPRNLLLKWENYPEHVRHFVNEQYDEGAALVQFLEGAGGNVDLFTSSSEEIPNSIYPRDFKPPAASKPRPSSQYISSRNIYKIVLPLADSLANKLKRIFPYAEVTVLSRNASIPKNAIVYEFVCQPANRILNAKGKEYPDLFIRLRKSNAKHRYDTNDVRKMLSQDEFRNYLFHLDVNWELRFKGPDTKEKALLELKDQPDFSSPYFKDTGEEFMRMIQESKEKFALEFEKGLRRR